MELLSKAALKFFYIYINIENCLMRRLRDYSRSQLRRERIFGVGEELEEGVALLVVPGPDVARLDLSGHRDRDPTFAPV